jgi:hypothetical protein
MNELVLRSLSTPELVEELLELWEEFVEPEVGVDESRAFRGRVLAMRI